jgi:hypothetical protein
VYSRERLLRPEHVHLHRTGTWYVEPVDWRLPQPFRHGYEDFAEAFAEADIAEQMFPATSRQMPRWPELQPGSWLLLS